MTTVCVQNTHSWFAPREASNLCLWTGANPRGEIPTKKPAVELFLTLKDGELESLQFSDMDKVDVKDGTVSFSSTEEICKFIERLFSFTGIPDCLVSPDLHLDKVRDLLYNLKIVISNKSLCIVNVATCGCNMGHCGAVVGWGKSPRLKTVREIFSWFDCSSDSQVINSFCEINCKDIEEDFMSKIIDVYCSGRMASLTSEKEKEVYQKLVDYIMTNKGAEHWVEYPDSVFLYIKPLTEVPVLDPPCYGEQGETPSVTFDFENEVYIQCSYGR